MLFLTVKEQFQHVTAVYILLDGIKIWEKKGTVIIIYLYDKLVLIWSDHTCCGVMNEKVLIFG